MAEKHFHLRLDSSYQGADNNIDGLKLDIFDNETWEPVGLDARSPGFLLFINGLFSCQHLYMRTNCAERGLLIDSATGELQVTADDSWHISHTEVKFNVRLRSGQPDDEDIDYIIDRMGHCPVSSNLPAHIVQNKKINFEA